PSKACRDMPRMGRRSRRLSHPRPACCPHCSGGTCVSCEDNKQDGDETGVDRGGPCGGCLIPVLLVVLTAHASTAGAMISPRGAIRVHKALDAHAFSVAHTFHADAGDAWPSFMHVDHGRPTHANPGETGIGAHKDVRHISHLVDASV